jgi:hypothetical protein
MRMKLPFAPSRDAGLNSSMEGVTRRRNQNCLFPTRLNRAAGSPKFGFDFLDLVGG